MARLFQTSLAALLLLTAPSFGSPDSADFAAGEEVYGHLCSMCHGVGGRGDGPMAQQIGPPPGDFSTGSYRIDADGDGNAGQDADLALVIKKGAAAFGGSVTMTPWDQLPRAEIENLVAYIQSLKRPAAQSSPIAR